MKFSFSLSFILSLLFAFFLGTLLYVEEMGVASAAEIEYVLLEPMPDGGGGSTAKETVNVVNFPEYVNNIIRLIIGISALLAVLMITIGGFKYMIGGAESLGTKQEGREQIEHAILGFLLLLGCYFILSIINPDLLRINLTPTKVQNISAPNPINTAGHKAFSNVGENVGKTQEKWVAGCSAIGGSVSWDTGATKNAGYFYCDYPLSNQEITFSMTDPNIVSVKENFERGCETIAGYNYSYNVDPSNRSLRILGCKKP